MWEESALGWSIAVVIAGVTIIGHFWIRYHFKSREELENHARFLIGNVLRSWSKVEMKADPHEYPQVSLGFVAVKKRPNFNHAKKHIQRGYPGIWKTWVETQDLKDDYNKAVIVAEGVIEEITLDSMTKHYPDIPKMARYNENVKDSFFTDNLFSIVFNQIIEARMSEELLIDWNIEYMRGESGISFAINQQIVMTTTQNEHSHDFKWKNFLDSIYTDFRAFRCTGDIISIRKKLRHKLSEFKLKMKELCESVDAGGRLEGTCDVTSWFTKM